MWSIAASEKLNTWLCCSAKTGNSFDTYRATLIKVAIMFVKEVILGECRSACVI